MFEINEGFKRLVSLSYTKADGTPGTIEGVPVWEISPTATSTMTVAADGMSAELAWAGVGDGATLTITADGDLGTGVFPIVITETFNFLAPVGATAGAAVVGAEVPV